MAIEIHREPLYRRYYSSVLSWSFLYIIFIWFLIIFLPLIIAYNSYDFWIKEAIVYEQPRVTYRYEVISQLYGESVSAKRPVNIFFSTSPIINQLYESNLRMARLSSINQDDNNDGKTDRIELNLQYPLSPDESISGFSAIVYSDVEIYAQARYIYDSMTYVNHDSANPIANLMIDGNLIIRQSLSFDAKGGFKKPYGDEPLLNINNDLSTSDVAIAAIMAKSNSRNFSLVFEPFFQYAERTMNSLGTTDKHMNYFNVSLTMRIPTQPIRYSPPASVLLKNAWIQYVAYLIVIAFLLTRLNSFVFRYQLLPVYPVADVIIEKME